MYKVFLVRVWHGVLLKISSLLLWSRRMYPDVRCKYFISTVRSLFFPHCLIVQISLPYKMAGRATDLYNFNLVLLWTKFGFNVWFKSPSICKKFVILGCMSFSSWYEMLHPRYVKVFTCSNIMLSITILILIGSIPLKSMIFFYVRFPYRAFVLFGVKACNPLCKLSSEFEMTTWTCTTNMVFNYLILCHLIFSIMYVFLIPQLVWTRRLEKKSFASAGNRTPIAQSVIRHYTDWATQLHCRRPYKI
jgi:hypothetical protein